MRHLILCREYPPAPSGGIGTYAFHLTRLLAARGETVHVIGQRWAGCDTAVEERAGGRLIVHRLPLADWKSSPQRPSPALTGEARALFASDFYPQSFSWQAGLLAERLVEEEGIDVVEAQEFEAPLYYFQLRRALGLGPRRQPPCIVHLHSPMELIARSNDWEIGQPYCLTAKRLEDYSIMTADAVLCPSRYLARQAAAHYGLPEGSLRVIPHPLGDGALLARDAETWERGSCCYVGRLERRKGVVEWLEAAVSVAPDYPHAQFEFVGANILGSDGRSGEEVVRALIPRALRGQFRFRGKQRLGALATFLSRARIAVVPSRWENFPYSCMEAMVSGLPVLASREGGMAEMVVDGRSGWLAASPSSAGLAAALRRALATPPAVLAEMGTHAAADIGRLCDNERVLDAHLRLRHELAGTGAARSLGLPATLPAPGRPRHDETPPVPPQRGEGIAIVVICTETGRPLADSLASLQRQSRPPLTAVVVDHGPDEGRPAPPVRRAGGEGWHVLHVPRAGVASAKNAGIEAVLGAGLVPRGFAFLSAGDRLEPTFVETCDEVLRHRPEVGLVSCWLHDAPGRHRLLIAPCPSFPYQWLANDAAPFSVVRTAALDEAGRFRAMMSHGFEEWDLFNAVMVAGWVAVTVPAILGRRHAGAPPRGFVTAASSYWTMRTALLGRFAAEVARDAQDITLLAESYTRYAARGTAPLPLSTRARLRALVTNPVRTSRAVLRRLGHGLRPRVPPALRALLAREFVPKKA